MADKYMDYARELRELKASEPERLYLLYGEEDFLLEHYLGELIAHCGTERGDEFNFRSFSGSPLDIEAFSDAVESLPFLSDRTVVLLRGFDINKSRDADRLKQIFADIPSYATLVIIPGLGYKPDMRLSLLNAVKKHGRVLDFTRQNDAELRRWLRKPAAALGLTFDHGADERLVLFTGGSMSRMLPELEKLAHYCRGGRVTVADVEAVVAPALEARVFDLSDRIAEGNWDGAARELSELLDQREEPIMLVAVIAQQLRRIYAARLALDMGLGENFPAELYNLRRGFITRNLMQQARGFSLESLASSLEACARLDYELKSSGGDPGELLCDFLLSFAIETQGLNNNGKYGQNRHYGGDRA